MSHDHWSDEFIRQAGLDPRNPALRHLIPLVEEIQDFPRHLSIHPGGFLLGHRPVHDLVPIENASMQGRTVIQWDKEDVDQAGLFKVDLLGLGALTHLHLCFDLLRRHRQKKLSLVTIPKGDPSTFEMICRSHTVGVFQIESRAQMAMLGRLKPRSYYDLVIEISIVRPGPITGGMVHPYLRRRNGQEEVEYPHPCLIPVLKKTLGIPLFQEQVMQLAMVAADYSPGEADQLRRDMAAWRRSGRIERHRQRLVTRMVAKGIQPEFAERVFQQIRGFGEYGFPESHAASFAHIAYATAYLKCHYPAEFVCALLNAQPMGFYSADTIVNDARIHGIAVRPVSILDSHWDCSLVEIEGAPEESTEFAVRMGLRYVKGLGREDWQRLAEAARQAPFRNLSDVARREPASPGQAGSPGRGRSLRVFRPGPSRGSLAGSGAGNRTPARPAPGQPRSLAPVPLPERAGNHPLGPISPAATAPGPTSCNCCALPWKPRGCPPRANSTGCRTDAWSRYAGMVICRQRPGTAGGVTFMTLEDETGFVNLVIWKQTFERYSLLAKTLSCMGVTGNLQVAEGVTHLIVQKIWKPELEKGSLHLKSRDFH